MAAQAFGDEHTRTKLETVEKYLRAFTTALKRQGFELLYVDACAGSGSSIPRSALASRQTEDFPSALLETTEAVADTDQIIVGSAIRALGVQPPFDRYLFAISGAVTASRSADFATRIVAIARDGRITDPRLVQARTGITLKNPQKFTDQPKGSSPMAQWHWPPNPWGVAEVNIQEEGVATSPTIGMSLEFAMTGRPCLSIRDIERAAAAMPNSAASSSRGPPSPTAAPPAPSS